MVQVYVFRDGLEHSHDKISYLVTHDEKIYLITSPKHSDKVYNGKRQ